VRFPGRDPHIPFHLGNPPTRADAGSDARGRGARRARGAARRGFTPGGAFFLAAARARPPIFPRD